MPRMEVREGLWFNPNEFAIALEQVAAAPARRHVAGAAEKLVMPLNRVNVLEKTAKLVEHFQSSGQSCGFFVHDLVSRISYIAGAHFHRAIKDVPFPSFFEKVLERDEFARELQRKLLLESLLKRSA